MNNKTPTTKRKSFDVQNKLIDLYSAQLVNAIVKRDTIVSTKMIISLPESLSKLRSIAVNKAVEIVKNIKTVKTHWSEFRKKENRVFNFSKALGK